MISEENCILIVPTLNPGIHLWREWIERYENQTFKPKVYIIDSGSNDGSFELSKEIGFYCHKIEKNKFDHGGTRNLGVTLSLIKNEKLQFAIFLTQDALLTNIDSLEKLIYPMNEGYAASYGRQLPHKKANYFAIFSRNTNYPKENRILEKKTISEFGIRAVYMSNSFSVYSLEKFLLHGKFPENIIFGEDMYLASKLIMNGERNYYNSDACVYHSHNYSAFQEFQRYFDIGVFHRKYPFIKNHIGGIKGEGFKYAKNEILFLIEHKKILTIKSMYFSFLKILAVSLGKYYNFVPNFFRKKISMNTNY